MAAVLLLSLSLRGPIAAVSPVLTRMRTDLAMNPAQAALLTALPVLCFALASPLALAAFRRWGLEVAVLGGLLVLLLGMVVRSWPGRGALPALIGTGLIGLAITVGNVLTPVVIKRDFAGRTALVTGLYTAGLCLGAALSAAFTAPLSNLLGWPVALSSWGWLIVLAVPPWVILLRAHPPGSGGARAQVPALWRDRTAVAITAVLGLQSALYYAVTAWLPTLLTDPPQIGGIGAGPGLAGVALSVFQLLGIIGTLAVAPLTRLGRDQRWLAVGAGLSWLLLLGGLLVAPHWWPVWAVLGGLTQGAGISLSFALLVLRSPDAQVAAAMSSFAQFCGYLLGAAGPVLLGAVYQSSGRWTPGLLSLGVLAVAMAAAGWVAGSRRPIGG